MAFPCITLSIRVSQIRLNELKSVYSKVGAAGVSEADGVLRNHYHTPG